MNEAFVTARWLSVLAMRPSIFSDAVINPALAAHGVLRLSAEIPTTRITPSFLNALHAGR
jgi:hypothetical protein